MIDWPGNKSSVGLLAAAAVGVYSGARLICYARSNPSATWRAISYALPVALTAFAAVAMGELSTAVAAIFAASVTAITLVLGIAVLAPNKKSFQPAKRYVSLILPVAIICLLIGFHTQIGVKQITILLTESLALLVMREKSISPQRATSEKKSQPILLVCGFILASVGAIAAVLAVKRVSDALQLPTSAMATSIMLGPILVLPMLGWASAEAHENGVGPTLDVQAIFIFLNLLVILPLAALLQIGMQHTALAATTQPADFPLVGLPYPMSVWRIDTILLIAGGLFLLPVGLGRWTLGRIEGAALLLAYVFYLLMQVAIAR